MVREQTERAANRIHITEPAVQYIVEHADPFNEIVALEDHAYLAAQLLHLTTCSLVGVNVIELHAALGRLD